MEENKIERKSKWETAKYCVIGILGLVVYVLIVELTTTVIADSTGRVFSKMFKA